jgi:hypothetical protein
MNENFFKHTINSTEYITGNGFIDICNDSNAVFCKTDYIKNYYNKSINVFITHNSDYEINDFLLLNGPKFNFWFAQNKNVINDRIIPIPIGIENIKLNTSAASNAGLYSSEVKGALYKSQLLEKYNSYDLEKQNLVYMNFNPNTFPKERNKVIELFSNKDWVIKTSNLNIEKLYFDISSSKFVFSPRGNGIDCHRTWEALYLKTIPIVKNSIHMENFKDLPIFFIDSWDEITEEKLNFFYEKVKNTLYNLDKLKISYWKKIINEKIKMSNYETT